MALIRDDFLDRRSLALYEIAPVILYMGHFPRKSCDPVYLEKVMKRYHFVFGLGVLVLVTISCEAPLAPIQEYADNFPHGEHTGRSGGECLYSPL